MKTSTILIISAIAIILISLTAYNFTLRASYRNGNYKNPFYGLEYSSVGKVTQVKLESSNNIAFHIRQGTKEGIYLSERAKDKIIWKVTQNVLKVDLTEDAKKNGFMVYDDDLVLVLSQLDQITLRPYFKAKQEANIKRIFGQVSLTGFRQDALNMDLGVATSAVLDSLKIGTLRAIIGNTGSGVSHLSLNSGQYQTAIFDIPGAGSLELQDPEITKTEYLISQAATVSLNGRPLKAIN